MRDIVSESLGRRRLAMFWLLAFLLPIVARAEAPTTAPATYTNPLNVDVADPFIIRDGNLYWLYGTSSSDGFKCWSSKDLVRWTGHGLAFHRSAKSWGENLFWAPCAIERGGTFYLYYSASGIVPGGQTHLRICVATSKSPAGPFKDARAPLLEIGKSTIDAHVFLDDDGKGYLYYALDNSENFARDAKTGKEIRQSHIYVVPLGEDLISVSGSPSFCTKPDQPWEGDTVNEAPFVFKHGKTYILMYSAHAFFEPEYCARLRHREISTWSMDEGDKQSRSVAHAGCFRPGTQLRHCVAGRQRIILRLSRPQKQSARRRADAGDGSNDDRR